MNFFKPLLAISLFCMILVPYTGFSSEPKPDYPVFTDIIYEWNPSGRVVQVGDFTISEFGSVWLDQGEVDANGNPRLARANKRYLRQGKIATVVLIKEKRDGTWIADRLIVFSGKGLKRAVKALSRVKREEYESAN